MNKDVYSKLEDEIKSIEIVNYNLEIIIAKTCVDKNSNMNLTSQNSREGISVRQYKPSSTHMRLQNTPWDYQEHDRIISILAWVVVWSLLAYATVFFYKQIISVPEKPANRLTALSASSSETTPTSVHPTTNSLSAISSQITSGSTITSPTIDRAVLQRLYDAAMKRGEIERRFKEEMKMLGGGPARPGQGKIITTPSLMFYSLYNAEVIYGTNLLKEGRYQEGVKYLTEAIAERKTDGLVDKLLGIRYNNRGVFYHLTGRYELAIKDFEEAKRLEINVHEGIEMAKERIRIEKDGDISENQVKPNVVNVRKYKRSIGYEVIPDGYGTMPWGVTAKFKVVPKTELSPKR